MSGNARTRILAAALALGLTACSDRPTAPADSGLTPGGAARSEVKFWDANAAADWNERATTLQGRRPAPPVMRLYTYLSLAQLRAAEDAQAIRPHPPTSSAIAAASAKILSSFFPADTAAIRLALEADQGAEPWSGAKHQDWDAGAAIGRAAAARVLAYALSDSVNLALPVAPLATPGQWTGTNPIHFAYKARKFFLKSNDELLPPAPPAFGSDSFNVALAEVLDIAINRTPAQDSIARYWMVNQSLASDSAVNGVAVQLIREHHRGEAESARILFLMNAAAFDASVACYNAKFTFWYIRPKQADPRIVTVFPAPNHPSYPSGHSCHSGSTMAVLSALFPSEREQLAARAEQASLSRLYAGIHYRFDMVAGLALGRRAAAKALAANLDEVAVR